MKLRILLLLFLTSSIYINAQKTIEKDTSLRGQFDEIYRISTSYQAYKVISKDRYKRLKIDVLDSLKASKKLLSEKEASLKTEKVNIQKIKTILDKTKQELEIAVNKENSISLFGIQLSKTTYNLILWSLIAILLFSLLYFIFKFSKTNVDTKKAQADLLELEQEFETHRKKSLEKEQKLRRQLQDEINKQRNP